MNWLFIIAGLCILGAPLIGFAVLAWLDLAPLGYEDAEGFHFGVPQWKPNTPSLQSPNFGLSVSQNPPRQRAHASPCLDEMFHNNSKNRRAAASLP